MKAEAASTAGDSPRRLRAVRAGAADQAAEREAEYRAEAETLSRIACELTAELDLHALVQKVTDAGVEITGARFGAFFYNTLDDSGESSLLEALSGISREEFEQQGLPRTTLLFNATFRGEGVVRIDDVLADPRFGQAAPHKVASPNHCPIRSYLAVPVVARSGAVLGGLFFGHSEPGLFNDHAAQMMVGVAAQAAVAIDNARLYGEAQRDIRERMRVEQALRESEARYRLVVEAANDYIWDWDLVAGRVTRNEGAERLFGYSAVEVGTDPAWAHQRIHPSDRQRVLDGIAAARDGGSDLWRDEYRFRRADGAYAHVLARAHFVRDAEGQALRMIGSVTDITETKRIKDALRTTEKQYRQLVQALPAAVYTCDAEGRIQIYNEAAIELWGQSPQIGKALWCGSYRIYRTNGEELPFDQSPVALALKEGRSIRGIEIVIERPDGTRRQVLAHPEPIRDAVGALVGAVNMLVDVTDAVHSQQALRESEERFARFMQRLPGLAWIKDEQGRYVFANAAAERAFRRPAAELYGRTDHELFPADTADRFGANDRLALAGEGGVETIETLEQDDGVHHSLVSKFPIPGASGAPTMIGGIAIDVTERLQAERALRNSEARFRSLTMNAPVAIFIKDVAGRYTLVNPLASQALGRPQGAEGFTDHDLLLQDGADRIRAIDLQVMTSGQVSEQEETVERPGYCGEFLSVKFPLRDGDGQVVGVCGVAVDVTERKRAQRALHESDQRLRLATQTGKLGVWDWDIAGDRISWSESLYAIHGVNPQWFSETVGDFSALVHPEDRELVSQSIQDAMDREAPCELEFRAVRADGETIWLFTNAAVLRRDGQAVRMLGATMDITERKRGEMALRESEERFRTLASHAPVGIFRSESHGDNIFVNEQWCEMAGMTPEQARGRGWTNAIHPDDRSRVLADWEKAVRTGSNSAAEFRFLRPDGVVTWLQGNSTPIRNADGEVTGFIGTVADITQRQRAEEALRNSERMYRAIGESIDYGVWVCDAQGRNIYCSESFLQLVGLTQEECTDLGWASRLHPDDVEQTLIAWTQCIRAGLTWDCEHRYRGVDGKWRPVLSRGVPVRDDEGEIIAWVGINLDISELKQAEIELRESEARFRSMADNAPVLIWVNGVGGCQFVNREYLRVVGATQEQLSGMNWTNFVHPEDLDAYLAVYHDAFERQAPFDAQCRIRCADGEYRWFSCTGAPRLRSDGRFLGYVGCSVDVTEIKESEDALRETDRRKDDFLAMLGHELRNPLAGIVTGAQVLGMLDLGGDAGEMQEVIARQAAHMSQIVDDLLDVSRIARGKLTLRQQHVNLCELLRDAVNDYRRAHALAPSTLECRTPLGDAWAWADPTRITQALSNVIHNSFKFGDGANKIAVELTVDGEQASIAVTDHGIGMTRETIDRIFEPFNQADTSLERSRGGLGLGLALAKGLVELHGGSVAAASEGLGHGSTITLRLPCVDPPGENAPVVSHARATSRRVLLVDDRRDAILPLTRMLEREGHVVAAVMDGPAALSKAVRFNPDVVLCDIGLDGDMNGYDVCRALRATPDFAATYLVAVTGYGQEEDRRLARDAGFDYHLTKPVGYDQLMDLLDRMPRF